MATLTINSVKYGVHIFSVSDEDIHEVNRHTWYLHKGRNSVGAKAIIDGKWTKLHRWIAKAPAGVEVDHENRDQYDCTRTNLKLATRYQQERNKGVLKTSSTGLRGVVPVNGKFEARLKWQGRRYYLGKFREPWMARLMYLITEWRLCHAESRECLSRSP